MMVSRAMLVVRVFRAVAVAVAGAVMPCVMLRVMALLVMSRVLQVCR